MFYKEYKLIIGAETIEDYFKHEGLIFGSFTLILLIFLSILFIPFTLLDFINEKSKQLFMRVKK